MRDDQRDLVLRALGELDQTYATLEEELAGCRDLCTSIGDWLQLGKDTIERMRRNEKAFLNTLGTFDRTRAKLQGIARSGG